MNEVIFNQKSIFDIKVSDINFLKRKCNSSNRGRFRICLHNNINHNTQEMVICHKKKSYIHPHKHPHGISESYHMIRGRMKIFFFDNKGNIFNQLELRTNSNTYPFLYRISKPIYHLIYPLSDYTIYHEVTTGPFIKKKNVIFAKFAPSENSSVKDISNFLRKYNIK